MDIEIEKVWIKEERVGRMRQRFCMHCGKELLEGAGFCSYCGAPVEVWQGNGNMTGTDTVSEQNSNGQNPYFAQQADPYQNQQIEIQSKEYEEKKKTLLLEIEKLKKEYEEEKKKKENSRLEYEKELAAFVEKGRRGNEGIASDSLPGSEKQTEGSQGLQFCPNCGYHVGNENYCRRCGIKVR